MATNIKDRSRALTAEDLIRRYNLEGLSKDRKAIQTNKVGLDKTDNILKDFVIATNKSIEHLESQVSGEITTWYFSGVPTLTNEPAKEWTTNEEKNRHLGDLYYDKDTGRAYRFLLDGSEYKWVIVTDDGVAEALAIANAAKDTADSKRRIFNVEPFTPYDSGDIWIYNGEIYRCIRNRDSGAFNTADWVNDLKYTDDTVANYAITQLSDYKQEVSNTYVTNRVFEASNNHFVSEINGLQVRLNTKNTIFKEEPTTPYIVGDVYVKEDKMYICVVAREEGEFNPDDWLVELDNTQYATKSQLQQTDDKIQGIVEQTTNIYTSEKGTGKLYLENLSGNYVVSLNIHPTKNDIVGAYPNENLYPNDNLYPWNKTLIFEGETNYEYDLPCDLFICEDVYDELVVDYEHNNFYIIHRVGTDKKKKYKLQKEVIEFIPNPNIMIGSGNYTVYMEDEANAYIHIRCLITNMYTDQFATKVELSSAITQTAEEINAEVRKKVGNDEVISKINQSAEQIEIDANKISLKGKHINLTSDNTTITSNNFNVDREGNVTANNANFNNGNFSGTINSNSGSIGGWHINNSQINNYDNTCGMSSDNPDWSFYAGGGNFRVAKNGWMYCNNANISGVVNATSGSFTGSINANSGNIAGWVINSEAIYNGKGIGVYGSTGISPTIQDWAFWANNGTFRVGQNGHLYCSDVDIKGNINATSGSFTGKVTATSGSFTGTVHASSGTFNGTIKASSGNISNWNIGSGGIYAKSSYDNKTWKIVPNGLDDGKSTYYWGRIVSSSDKRLKNSIKDIDNEYEDFFNNLKPKTFYYNPGDGDDKKHIGFIAQDILENQIEEKEDLTIAYSTGKYYAVDKTEIVALNTWQIQKLKAKVKEQEELINNLIDRIEALENK